MTIAMRSTAIGAFPSRAEAEQAVCSLLAAAFQPDQVDVVLPEAVDAVAASGPAGPTTLWAGALFRTLTAGDVSDEEVRSYEEALDEGRPLVMVCAGNRYSEAMAILFHCGGEYMAAF